MPFSLKGVEIIRQDPLFYGDNLIQYGDLSTEATTFNGINCGTIKTVLVTTIPFEPLPTWIKNDPVEKNIVVNLSGVKTPHFEKSFQLLAYLEKYPHVQYETKPFNVTLGSAGFSCLPNTGVKFTTGDAPVQFGLLFTNNTIVSERVKLT